MARVKEERDKRLFVAESFRVYETQCVKEEFEREKTQAETEFEVNLYVHTVEPSSNGHTEVEYFVHCSEVVPSLEENVWAIYR